ncbi:Gag-Pol polyprotein [Labeo rohita]|uniref:Gag-Pol polyprotein n=1 Tax=Labeo rohita TaxID=84645 RepID=A0ABQ8MMN5_LABRO|nr:Gag-Pol polyprotein [Labeo rohita]
MRIRPPSLMPRSPPRACSDLLLKVLPGVSLQLRRRPKSQDDHIEADPLAHTPRGLVSLDLKDAYFHIQIAPHHRRFLRFAFEGVAYQYTVLPFGLSLAPPQSEAELLSHRSLLLSHLAKPGTQGQFGQEHTASQPTNLVSGSSFRLDPDEGNSHARSSSGNTAARGLIQNRSLSPPQNVSKDARPYGLSVPSAKVRPALYAAPSVLAETTGSISCVASRTFAYQGGPGLCRSPEPLEELAMDGERRAPGYGLQEEGGHDRRFQHGSVVPWQTSFRPLDESRSRDLYQLPRDAGSVSSPSLLLARSEGTPCAGPLGQHDGGFLYKWPGGLSSKCLFTLVKDLLEWAQLNLCSLRATHVPGRVNQGADMLSRSNVPSGEWTLHPQAVQKIWEGRVGPRLAQPHPLCFSPGILDSSSTQASQGTETQTPSGGPSLEKPALVLRAVPAARSSPLAHSPEMRPPLGERDNMAPPAQAVGPASLLSGRESMNLSEKLLDKGHSPSTLKVYVAAITASHALTTGQSVGRNNLVVRFLKGSRRLNPPRPLTIPTWDLSTVLRALKGPPFEPLPGSDLRSLTLKAALLSVKCMGDLQALSVSPLLS